YLFFFSSSRRHTRFSRDWSSDVCSSDLSFSHSGFIDFNGTKSWMKEIEETDLEIQKLVGFRPKFFRPPFGVTTPHLADALRKSGHISIGWNIRTYDTVLKSPEEIRSEEHTSEL